MRGLALFIAIVVSGAVGVVAGQRLERINPPGVSTPQTYSHIVKAGKMLFIAGQVGATAEGKVAGATMKDQMEQVMKNLQTVLKSQGLDFSHVAKINIFTTSIQEFRAPEVAEIRGRYFGQNRPASTLVQIAALASPDYKIEIEAIAVAP